MLLSGATISENDAVNDNIPHHDRYAGDEFHASRHPQRSDHWLNVVLDPAPFKGLLTSLAAKILFQRRQRARPVRQIHDGRPGHSWKVHENDAPIQQGEKPAEYGKKREKKVKGEYEISCNCSLQCGARSAIAS